jgi:chorismate mutase
MDILAKLKELRDEIDGLYEATLASSQEYHHNRIRKMLDELESELNDRNASDIEQGWRDI